MVSDNQITWNGLTLKKGQTFVTKIRRVTLAEELTGDFEWETTIAGGQIMDNPETDEDETANVVVLGTVKEDVDFEIVDENDIPQPAPSYPAISEQQLRFRFTATNTAIQAGGRVWFTLPSGWTPPNLAPGEKDKRVKAKVGIGELVGRKDRRR